MLRNQIAALDGALTQPFTGNTGGLYCEIMGWKGNRLFRRSRAPLAEQIRGTGTARFSPALSPDEVRGLADLLDRFEHFRDTGERKEGVEAWMLPTLVLRPNTVRLSAEPDIPPGPITTAAATIQAQLTGELGVPIESLGTTLYRNRQTEDAHSISADWHFDRRPTDWMRAFIYLSDVEEDCGPFHFFDRSQSAALCRQGFRRKSAAWQDRVEGLEGFRRLTGPAGSGLLANAERILHRAGNPAPGRHRDMFEFIFRPARSN